MWNAVKFLGMKKEEIEKAFELSGIDQKRRGETLSLHEFAILSDNIINIRNS